MLLDVGEVVLNLHRYEAVHDEEEGQDVEPMIKIVLQVTDGRRDGNLLFGEPTDVITINTSPVISRLEGQGDCVSCVRQHI